MKYVSTPHTQSDRRLTFYLAMEEYVARHMDGDEYFFIWQVQPTVIFGRNQLIQNEVNIEYCRSHHINTFRRKSGGGCVYADKNNLMFSYITRDEDVRLTFSKYLDMVVARLRAIGVDATASGRNDIMIDNRKVSGNAFYHIPGRSIVHGTMLYDTDMENMVSAITPSDEKLVSKGIQSVRQHITLLKDYIQMDIEAFKTYMRQEMCDGVVELGEKDVRAIKEIEREYLSPEFIYGNNPRYNITRRCRVEGVGDLVVSMEMKNATIKDIDIKGDFFLVGDIGQQIIARLKGRRLERHELEEALPQRIDDVILNLDREQFINILTERQQP